MINNMGKDIATGVLLIGSVAVVVIAAEASLPIIAGIGALTSVGAGLYQALTAPKMRKHGRSAGKVRAAR